MKINNHETILKTLIEEDYFFKDRFDYPMVSFQLNGIKQYCMVDSQKYRSRISRLMYEKTARGISDSAMKTILNTLKAHADAVGIVKNTFLRIAGTNDKIIYDLANEKNEMIEISTEGIQVLKPNNEIIFSRFNHQKAQPYPLEGGKLGKILKYVNVDDSDRLLFCFYLISCFIPDIQHPICILHGMSGQGKSMASKFISEIVDPYKGELLNIPYKDDAFHSLLNKHWLLPFDNISTISKNRSDDFCKTTTGITYPARELYTTNDTKYMTAKRCIVLNGIENCATREDLLSRSLIFEIKRKENRGILPASELMADFNADKPYIIGQIFDVLSKALTLYPKVSLKINSRMAEFILWGYAIGEALNGRGAELVASYQHNIRKQESEAINSNTLISAVLHLMDEHKNDEWCMRPSDLLREIKRVAHQHSLNLRSETMPDSASALTRKLNAYYNLLKSAGVEYAHNGHTRTGSKISFKKA